MHFIQVGFVVPIVERSPGSANSTVIGDVHKHSIVRQLPAEYIKHRPFRVTNHAKLWHI